MSVDGDTYLRVDGQVEVRDTIATIDSGSMFRVVTSDVTALSVKDDIFIFADGSIDRILVTWIHIDRQREYTVASIDRCERNSIGARCDETSAM